jgi:hypothetical protein
MKLSSLGSKRQTTAAKWRPADLLPRFAPKIMRDIARLLGTGHGRLEHAAIPGNPHQKGRTHTSAVVLLEVSSRGQTGVKANTLRRGHGAATLMNSGCRGRWDRNRTGALRLWSTRRAVQRRPAMSKSPLNSQFLATHRPAPSKHVQPLCSQLCSQDDLHPSAGSRPPPFLTVQTIPQDRLLYFALCGAGATQCSSSLPFA